MRFEYHSFEVESFLKRGVQPVFMFSSLNKASKYYTLVDPGTGELSATSGISDAVRIPVFALLTAEQRSDSPASPLTHGSLLVGVGLETAMRCISNLKGLAVGRAIVVIATNCHELYNSRYRAYVGFSLEVEE